MKNVPLLAALFLLALLGELCTRPCKTEHPASGHHDHQHAYSHFGDSISPDGAIAAAQVAEQLKGKDSLALKVSGIINSVCQKKGCWMEMEIGDGKTMRVTFKDYAFFVPKDASGKVAIVEGYVYNDTISVEELRHYAEDAGQSKEEIEKITAPEVEISFEARGVIIENE